ncbi:MAG: hypothetical protein QNJ31_01120 [Candidatus Caenarcaniphilales bacterium]|nr:hypothetical protein [Candidatus Caenarcaniphilales bacterium]
MKLKLIFSFAILLASVFGFSAQEVNAKVMCCPPKDKCAPKPDKCSPKAQCVPKDKCSACPDGLVETHKWWKL